MKSMNSTIMASSLASTAPINSQFKHTIIWNGIVSHLRTKLVENSQQQHLSGTRSRLRKQHSKFVSGGMLLIGLNQTQTADLLQQQQMTTTEQGADVYFTGSQCVDMVYQYLVANRNVLNFERQITKEKCTKV